MLATVHTQRSLVQWLLVVTLVLGGAMLFCFTVGRPIALIALISVIGIPIYSVMAAIPTLFLFSLLTLIIMRILRGTSLLSMAMAGTLALAVMAAVPFFHNLIVRRYAAHFLRGDDPTPPATWTRGTLGAVLPPNRREFDCDSICQGMLAGGQAQRFVVVEMPQDSEVIQPGAEGKVYWLEQTRPCALSGRRASDTALRMMIGRGYCLMEAPARLDQADTVIWHQHLRQTRDRLDSFDPRDSLVAAERISVYQRDNHQTLRQVHRETSVRYSTLFPLLIYTYIFRGITELDAGYLRDFHQAGAAEILSAERFVKQRMGVEVAAEKYDEAKWQNAITDTLLQQANTAAGIDPVLSELQALELSLPSGQLQLSLARCESLVDALLANPEATQRVPVRAFVESAYRSSPQLGDAVTSALIDRGERADAIAAAKLAEAFDGVPDKYFPQFWPRLRPLLANPRWSNQLPKLIRRAWLAQDSTADLLGALDSLKRMEAPKQWSPFDLRKRVFSAAYGSFCSAGLAGRADPSMLQALVQHLQSQPFFPAESGDDVGMQDGTVVANTLAAMGASRAVLVQLQLPTRIRQQTDRALEQALRKPNCAFQ